MAEERGAEKARGRKTDQCCNVLCVLAAVEKLNKLHTSRLMVRFDGSESKYEQEIDHVTQEITDEFRSAEKGLRRMAQSDRNGEFSAADAKTRQNVQRYVGCSGVAVPEHRSS